MITKERDFGRILPTTWDPSLTGLSWSFRLAYTAGVLNSNTNWVYYELPDTCILTRNRSASLDQMSQQLTLSVLADALPDYFEPLNYWMLEVDLVDSTGYRWPYHTGRIDSIKESFELAGGGPKRVMDISSFGVLQNLKDAYTLEDKFPVAVSVVSQYMTPYATVKHVSVLGTGRAIGTLQVVQGSWNTLDLYVAGTFPGFVLSTNSDFSAPYTRGVQYDLVNSAGAAITVATSKNELVYVKWLVAEPAVRYYMKFWTVDYFGVARIDGSTFPDSFRVPDCNIPFSYGYRPPLKRNTWDDFVTTVASATTTVITPVDAESYKQTLAVNPVGAPTEYLEWMKADTLATEVRQISSVSAATGAVTVSVAFSAAPAAGDYIRVVSTRCFTAFERNNNDGSTGVVNRPRFYKQLAGTEHIQGAFSVVPDQGIVTANYGNHFQTGSGSRLFVSDLVCLSEATSTFGTDNRVESSAYLAVVDFVPSRVYSGNSSDGVNYYGNHQPMRAWTQNLNISGGTREETLQALVDNGFPPNGKIFDRPDGSVLVAAIKQKSEAQYSLANVITVSQDAVPQPNTAVTVISRYPTEYRLPRGSFEAETSNITNDFYLFDGVDSPDPTNSGTDFAFASVAAGTGTLSIRIPDFGKTVVDPLTRVVVKGLSGVVLMQVVTLTTAGDVVQKVLWLKGGQYQTISQGSDIVITGDEITKALAYLRMGNGYRNTQYAALRFQFTKSDIVSTGATDMIPRITEIELYTNYLTSWTAYLTDDQAYTDDLGTFPTGWTTVNSTTNTGSIWWKRDRLARSFKYIDPATLKRIQPLWNADWPFNLYRHTYINQTRISQVACREIGERYLDELIRKATTYNVTAFMDPRVEIGDTVAVQLPDGTVKDLLVWSVSDSGTAEDLEVSLKLVDYSA